MDSLTEKCEKFCDEFTAWAKEQILLCLCASQRLRFPRGDFDTLDGVILHEGEKDPSALDLLLERWITKCKELGGFPLYVYYLQIAFYELADDLKLEDDLRNGRGGYKTLRWCFWRYAEKAVDFCASVPPCHDLSEHLPYIEAFPAFAKKFWSPYTGKPGAFFTEG